MQQEQLGFLMA